MRLLFAVLCVLGFIAPDVQARMFKGEVVLNPDGYPALVHFQKGTRGRPLVVLVAGAGTTARVFYGVHDDRRPNDFLATHLVAMGYNVLAVTSPIDTQDSIFQSAYPDFTIQAWGKMLAKVAGQYVAQHDLSPNVILAGWSMGGKAAQPMAKYAPDEGIELSLFVSLAATPPVHGVIPMAEDFALNPATGYGVAPDPEYRGFLWNIGVNARKNGIDAIIPNQDLIAHYVGEGPVGLSHTGIRYRDGSAVSDLAEDRSDGGGSEFDHFPVTATLVPIGRHDLRHSTTDRHTWGMFTTNRLYQTIFAKHRDHLRHKPSADILALSNLIRSAPDRLSRDVFGNHFFFLGEDGARRTAAAIAWVDAEARVIRSDIRAIIHVEHPEATAELH